MTQTCRTALLLMGALSLWGCHRPGAWPDDGKHAFLATCQKNNPQPGGCDCMVAAMEKTLTWSEFQAFQDVQKGRTLSPDKMAKVRDAVAACDPAPK